jgi:hypothetical protein
MPIRWERSEFGWHGYLQKVKVFTIYWGVQRGQGMMIDVNLPGMLQHPSFESQDLEVVKNHADKILNKWLSIMGLYEKSEVEK